MVLTTHAITGAAFASLTPNQPLLGFAVGFASHFVLDAIPHWDYRPVSLISRSKDPIDDDMLINKDFVFDLFKLGGDTLLGFTLAYLFFGLSHSPLFVMSLFAGAAGAVLPDALKFVYFKFRHEPFKSIERFHLKVQTHLENNHTLGREIQMVVLLVIILLQKLIVK